MRYGEILFIVINKNFQIYTICAVADNCLSFVPHRNGAVSSVMPTITALVMTNAAWNPIRSIIVPVRNASSEAACWADE
jgi:hypothetical protein